jgi:hypothetical protein
MSVSESSQHGGKQSAGLLKQGKVLVIAGSDSSGGA